MVASLVVAAVASMEMVVAEAELDDYEAHAQTLQALFILE